MASTTLLVMHCVGARAVVPYRTDTRKFVPAHRVGQTRQICSLWMRLVVGECRRMLAKFARHVVGFGYSDGAFTLDNVDGNCLWTRTQTEAYMHVGSLECCTATEEDVEFTRTVLSTYPQSSDGDFWQRKCVNASTCVLQEFGSEYTNFVNTQRNVEDHMNRFGLTASFDPLTCSLYNVGAATYECRSQLVCTAPTCSQVQVQGQNVVTEPDVGTTCGAGETVCPLLSKLSRKRSLSGLQRCPTCGRSYVNTN